MTNQQTPEIYTLHTVPNKGERPWSGIYTVRADAEHDAKVMRDVTGRDWSVVRLVVADTAAPQPSPTPQADSQPAPVLSDDELVELGKSGKSGLPPWGTGTTRADYLRAVRAVLAAARTLADSVMAPATGTGPKPVTDADVRNMSARVISGQAEEDELLEFFARLAPPHPVHIAAPTPPAQAADSVPKARFDDPKVQAVYAILCSDVQPPKGEHWEGFAARSIVDALSADSQPAPVDARHPTVVHWRNDGIEACAKIAEAYGNAQAALDMRAMLTPQ